MKGMEQVAAGNTRLIQQGNVLISEMESLPKRNLPLGAYQQLVPDRGESAVSAIANKSKRNLLPWCLKSWQTSEVEPLNVKTEYRASLCITRRDIRTD